MRDMGSLLPENRLRNLHPIGGSGDDPPGIAGAFTGGIQTNRVDALEIRAAPDADRRRGACFYPCQYRIRHGEAPDLLFECKSGRIGCGGALRHV